MKDPFEKIIGYEDIKKELRIISDMMNHPEVYKKMGASMERGLLLYGKPGTGKTTMANCLINSTKRSCFTCRKKNTDGEFVEKIVQIFEEAKKNAPSIIFLDDVDKFTDKPEGYESPEEFVTIQRCMDELADSDVFVIATANNYDRLPDSLLRPGRLGKGIKVRIPRKDETAEIIKFYLDQVNTSKDLDPVSIAMMLEDESCAVLGDVVRAAAVKSAYNRQDCITMDNIVDACLDLVFDAKEFKHPYSDETIRRTAYHEAGHALAAELLDPGSVSIASVRASGGPRLGFVRYSRKNREEITFDYHVNMLKTSLAGKAATEIVFGESDTGANSDLHHAFDMAEDVVDNYCSYGFHNWIQDRDSDGSAENRNRAMAIIMETYYMDVKKLLIQNRQKLDVIAAELMRRTTLIHKDIGIIMKTPA